MTAVSTMQRGDQNLASLIQWICCAVVWLWLGLFFGRDAALGAGLNAENHTPALDHHSGLMWESKRTTPAGSLLRSYTFSYLLRPVEFGDGEDFRLPVSDHLQVNHLGISYGATAGLQVGVSVPIALYSAPETQGYISSADEGDRKFFFFGDPVVRAKFSLFPNDRYGFGLGVLGEFYLPFGSSDAFLSDDSFRLNALLLLQWAHKSGWEVFLNGGPGFWTDEERVVATDPETDEKVVLVAKSSALFLQTGVRFWVYGDARKMGSIQAEAGLRGEFEEFDVSLNGRASPIEWAAGGLYFLTRNLSLHGLYGAGIGSAVTAPLTRIQGGLRYLTGGGRSAPEEDNIAQIGVTSESYSDEELDVIFEEAKAEQEPQSRASLETLLRLKTEYGVLDIGSVNFEFDSSNLTAEARQTIRRLHEELLKSNPKSIKIDGHTDSVGSFQYNLALSKRRANAVRDELVRLGQDARIIRTEGFSFKYPMTSNATPEGRAANRRIEVSVDGLSFRKQEYSREEIETFRRWIYPGGDKAKVNMNRPDLND